MLNKLYLGDFLGWETAANAKVAISQLREASVISRAKCPKVQLLKNRTYRYTSNFVKFLGYLPFVHFIVGIGAIFATHSDPDYLRPNHRKLWAVRGVAMFLLGPALIIADLVKFIFDYVLVFKYNRAHKNLIDQFNTSHGHTREYWPGHPIYCAIEGSQSQLVQLAQEG